MHYMLLIHQGDAPTPRSPEDWARLSEDGQKAVFADYQAVNATVGVTPGQWLDAPETATTVRVQDGERVVTDGPFAETKEQLGGYYEIDVANLDDAIEAAARCPGAGHGTIELRPIMEFDLPQG